MKKRLLAALLLAAAHHNAQAANTVLLTDDFEDASIDPSKWALITASGHTGFDESSAGGIVTETSGYLWIQNAAGAFKSILLPVNGYGEIVIDRNLYVSRGSGTLVSRPDEIVAEDGTVLLRWGYHYYSDGGTNRYGFGGFDDTLVPATWDAFFDETITYDPATGQGSYSSANGSTTITGTPLPAGTTHVYLRGSAYAVGSATDYKAIVDFTASQAEVHTLTVASAYGAPSPSVGDSVYSAGTVIDCSATNLAYTGFFTPTQVRYACVGWNGTGSVPASGATNAVAVALNEDSSITWNWEPLDAVLTVSSGFGSPYPTVGSRSYSIGTELTCSVQNEVTVNGIRYRCAGWTGSGSVPASGSANSVVVTVGATSSITWIWENLESRLAVVSAHGDPVPAVGDDMYAPGTVVTCSVENVVGPETRHYCTGWQKHGYSHYIGSYYYITAGTTNWTELELNSPDLRLTWLWETDHRLDIQVEGSGTVSQASGFYDEGSVQTLTATPAEGWVFDGWSGDATGTGSAPLTMDAPKSAIATFSVPASIANLSVAQVEGAREVEVTYDVAGTRSLLVDLEVFQNGSNLNASALSGAVGMVSAGPSNTITWNAGTDWNLNVDELTFNLLSEDGLPFYAPYTPGPWAIPKTQITLDYYMGIDGEDGDLQAGMVWPSPRFADNGDGTVTDNMTGLQWGKTASYTSWYNSMSACENLSLAGHDDWRLPNVREMRSLLSNFSRSYPVVELGVFSNFSTGNNYWTSTRLEYNTGYAYAVYGNYGYTLPLSLGSSYGYLPVRGSSTGMVAIAKTGQANSWDAARSTEDGDLQTGQAWPEPRFTDHGDGTATDHLTGLMWCKTQLGSTYWAGALNACNGLTAAGHTDWRLPNINELETLVDYGEKYPSPTLPADHPFVSFPGGTAVRVWSSSTPYSTGYGYIVDFYNGHIDAYSKGNSCYVMACRGGVEIQETISEPTTYEPLPVTGQTNSFAVGDDGDLQKGVKEFTNEYIPRFGHSGSGRFHDSRTGLEWYVSDGYNTSWTAAIVACEYSSSAGATDWRLPNVREMLSLLDYGQSTPMLPEGHPFADWTNVVYWTSTVSPHSTDYALTVNLNDGTVFSSHRGFGQNCFCLVRWMTEPVDVAAVPKTGQTFSLRDGDDGFYQKGVAVAGERFADNGNGTVNDNQTGLVWLKDAASLNRMNWSNAVAACESMHFGNYSDWRLPNARELESLITYSTNAPVTPDMFDNVKFTSGAAYWSSTTAAGNAALAVEFKFDTGRQGPQYKENPRYVWPVRGGN
ncbi:hypothetical protein PDESU_05632 [Pontiella desulfatans]|uniref:Uncharacterized protein n=1 Tax=Pontiella desulfatans TaxID=2750659 RepID=A0A6C2UAB2_PONDE|nr:DUF1566 domain-containing protein [Pontiella desulfatans]VGO17038.1 hypothetical protein PDESU_05632 [Pontiella desulfatans]